MKKRLLGFGLAAGIALSGCANETHPAVVTAIQRQNVTNLYEWHRGSGYSKPGGHTEVTYTEDASYESCSTTYDDEDNPQTTCDWVYRTYYEYWHANAPLKQLFSQTVQAKSVTEMQVSSPLMDVPSSAGKKVKYSREQEQRTYISIVRGTGTAAVQTCVVLDMREPAHVQKDLTFFDVGTTVTDSRDRFTDVHSLIVGTHFVNCDAWNQQPVPA